jgi:PAS domain S-box-containing protein
MKTSGSGFEPGALAPDQRARRLALFGGGLILLVGVSDIIAWIAAVPALLQPLPGFSPLSFTAAVGEMALGLGLVGLASGHRRAMAVGGLTALLLGLATLIQAGTGFDPGLGLSPASIGIASESNAPFHVPVSTGLLLLFAGAGQLAFVIPARAERGRLFAGALGSIVVVLCLGILATRIVVSPDAGGGLLVGSALQVLGGSLVIGLLLVFAAWSADPSATATTPWVPLSIGLGLLVTVLLVWRTLISHEREQAREATVAAVSTARREISRQVETAARVLSRLARFGSTPQPASPAWASAMLALTRDIDGLRGIAWTDRAAIVREYRPTPIPSDTLRLDIQRRLASLTTTVETGASNEVTYFALGDSGRSFAAAVPICALAGCTGYIVGIFDAERLLRPVLGNRGDGYLFRVESGSTRILGPRRRGDAESWTQRASLGLGKDVSWEISAEPSRDTVRRLYSGLPDLLLLLGLLVTALVPVTLRLGQMTLTRARLAERVRLNQALETANDGIWEWDIASGAAMRSETLWRHLGYDPVRVAPEMDSWQALIHPEDERRVRDALADHLVGKSETFEAQYRVRDHGGEWHWVIDRGRVVERSGTGAPRRMLGISADVTVRKRAEDELREVHSLTTMGRLAARVAHEINNPLAGIQNAFTLIKDAVPETHPHRRYVGAIEREIGRIAGVTRQLYETYRPEAAGSPNASVSSVVGDAVALLEQLNRGSQVRIQVDLSAAPAVVRLPDPLLRQAVYNLVQNAVEASPAGGTVLVRATVESGAFTLRVRDQGPGIPAELRERIFEPFFTTKAGSVRTGGMGLGLSMVRHSVQAFGGRVEILDPPGGGTEIVVRLPLNPIEPGVPA